MAFLIKSVTLIILLCAISSFAETAADQLMSSANQKIENINNGGRDCLKNKDSCPKAIPDWVNDDKSFGLLPSYEKLGICQTPKSILNMQNANQIAESAHKVFPQITAQSFLSTAVCSSGSSDLDRKAMTKSIYFLARVEKATASNINQIAAYDSFLGDKALSKISCDSPVFTNLQKQCQNLSSCTNSSERQKHIKQIANIENENKLIDESIQILEKKLPYAKVNLSGYTNRGGKDPAVIAERQGDVTKIQEQLEVLKMLKQANLKKYPVLTDPEFIEAREDNDSVEAALKKAYANARGEMVQQTQNFLDKSLCAVSIAKKDCDPSDLNATLAQTQDLQDITFKDQTLAPIADGISQQRCIFDNVMDHKGTAMKIYKATGHAIVDVALTLAPGGVALVLASRAKTAAEVGINVAKTTAKAAQTTEKVVATVGATWFSQSLVAAGNSCQTKFNKQSLPKAENVNQCAQAMSAFYAEEFDSSECMKAVFFAAMDGLPVVAQAASYVKRSREFAEILDETKKSADAVQAVKKAKVKKEQAFKEVQVSNPQTQIWSAKKSGDAAKAQRVDQVVRTELAGGKIVSNEKVTRAGNVGIGRSGARYVKYDTGVEGVWKPNVPGENSVAAEIAAAKIDDHLGADQVPITVERELDGVKGAVQLKVNGLRESKTNNPDELRLTDYLNGNSDRSLEGNHVEAADGKAVAIDNGRAFSVKDPTKPNYGTVTNPLTPKIDEVERIQSRIRETEANLQKLTDGTASEAFKANYSEKQLREELAQYKGQEKSKIDEVNQALKKMLPNDQWEEKLRATSRADWEKLLGDKLNSKQIDDLVFRQQDILNSLERVKNLAPIRPKAIPNKKEVERVSDKMGEAGFRFFRDGRMQGTGPDIKHVRGTEVPLMADTIQSGKSYTVIYQKDGTLTLGENYKGFTGDTSKSHIPLYLETHPPGSVNYTGGALRVNADGSIDVSGYHRRTESEEAAKAIKKALEKAIPGVIVRTTKGRLPQAQ